MRKPWRNLAVFAFFGALVFGVFAGPRLLAVGEKTKDGLRLYTEIIQKSKQAYGGEVLYKDLVYASIQGMLRDLDPHTSFLSPESYTSMRERQKESFFGLGILVGVRDGALTVITPIPGGPAHQLGMRAGDIISEIEGEPTETMSLDDAVGTLKGPKDTQVKITVIRRGMPEPFELEVTRAQVAQETVTYAYMLDDETGYMMLREFGRSTGREVADSLAKLKAEGMKRLVVDLRSNGGGLLDQAIEVVDQFVPPGSKIVETRGRVANADSAYFSSGRYEPLAVPVVVLVSGGTASAAEILSGAIQDHDMGLIIGEPTWGKGLVQTVYTLPYGSGMALTTAKYYTPSGRLIQRDYSSFWDYYTQYDPDADPTTDDTLESYQTDLGRRVYGGGGITPDVHVEPELLPVFLQYLRGRAAFLKFAVDHLADQPIVSADWQPQPELLDEFRAWLLSEEVATAEEIDEAFADDATHRHALTQIHYEIANSRFGVEAGHRVLAASDNQLQRALELFDEAADMLMTREALTTTGPQGQVATLGE